MWRRAFKNFDWGLFLAMILLAIFGQMVIYSFSPTAAREQMIFFGVGLAGYFFLSFSDYRFVRSLAFLFFLFSLLLLFLTYLSGTVVYGSARWFNLGGINFQPSEFAKLALIIALSSFLSSRRFDPAGGRSFFLSLLLTLLPSFFVFHQPDLGTASVLMVVWFSLLLVAGLRLRFLFITLAVLLLAAGPFWLSLKDYQQKRVLTFLNPELDPLGAGYNVHQSVIAVGSGGLFGRGFGRGTQSHLQFLPAYQTDFIFASLAEEWGLLGAVVFLALFAFLLWRLIAIAQTAPDDFGTLLAVGVLTMLSFQVFVNVGMNLGLLPVAGIPLPLLSVGGSSLITTLLSLGLVQSLARRRFL